MISFRINFGHDLIPADNKRKYSSKRLVSMKAELDKVKSKLDVLYKNPNFGKYWKEFDPFKNEKLTVARLGNTVNVSNAWLKCYDILTYYDLIPHEAKDFLHFDNAAFPGSFIISTHHFVKTNRRWHDEYNWVGSSLIESNAEDKEPLEDKYHLFKNYPRNWLMSDTNNGDVLVKSNQEDFYEKLHNKVDLYTSDLGFDVSSDYNNQELLQMPANIGQILTGVLTLKQGGAFITKQYTAFDMTTISVMFALSQLFDEFYFCKPPTSRQANSETYLVGKGFRGVTIDHPYVQAMFRLIESKNNIPIFDVKRYPSGFIGKIIEADAKFSERQIEKLNHDINECKACMGFRGRTWDNPRVIKFRNQIESDLEEWYRRNQILPIPELYQLSMKDALRQKN